MKKLIPVALLVLVVSACAGTPETRATNGLAIACDTYATVLDELTPYREAGELSPANINRVDSANAMVDPVCLPGSIVDPNSAIALVRNGINLLTAIKGAS